MLVVGLVVLLQPAVWRVRPAAACGCGFRRAAGQAGVPADRASGPWAGGAVLPLPLPLRPRRESWHRTAAVPGTGRRGAGTRQAGRLAVARASAALCVPNPPLSVCARAAASGSGGAQRTRTPSAAHPPTAPRCHHRRCSDRPRSRERGTRPPGSASRPPCLSALAQGSVPRLLVPPCTRLLAPVSARSPATSLRFSEIFEGKGTRFVCHVLRTRLQQETRWGRWCVCGAAAAVPVVPARARAPVPTDEPRRRQQQP